MIINGRQIAAGRALLAMDQPTLAMAAGVHRNAISYWECRDTIPKVEPYAVQRIRKAMADAGVDFSSDPPGAWVMPSVHGAQFSEQYAREAEFSDAIPRATADPGHDRSAAALNTRAGG